MKIFRKIASAESKSVAAFIWARLCNAQTTLNTRGQHGLQRLKDKTFPFTGDVKLSSVTRSFRYLEEKYTRRFYENVTIQKA